MVKWGTDAGGGKCVSGVAVRGRVRKEGKGESSLPLSGVREEVALVTFYRHPKLYKSYHTTSGVTLQEPFAPPVSLKWGETER